MRTLLIALGGLFILAACGGKGNDRSLQENFSAFLNENEKIVVFGSADLETILKKTDYKSQPLLSAFMGEPVGQIQSVLDLKAKMFYALEGPMTDGNPETVYAFMDVKNIDSLRAALKKNGFEIEQSKKGKYEYIQDHDVTLGFNEFLGIVVVKSGNYEGDDVLVTAFERSAKDVSSDRVNDMLAINEDITMAVSISNLYSTSNTDLNKLPKEKQKELKTMFADSYVSNSVSFDDGAIVIETKNLFSPELSQAMFMEGNTGVKMLSNLGGGDAKFGFAINMDMKKAQAFADKYSPEPIADLITESFPMAGLAMMATGNDLSKLFDGQMAAVMVGEKGQKQGLNNFNFYVGMTKAGKDLSNSLMGFLSSGDGALVDRSTGLSFSTSPQYASGQIQLPAGCESFGSPGITAFINMEGVDIASLELSGEAKVLELVKYANFTYTNAGGKLVIKAKEGKENALKQALNYYMQMAESQMSGVEM